MQNFREKLMKWVFFASALASVMAVVLICVFLFANGVPAMFEVGFFNFISGKNWSPMDIPAEFSILPMIMGSIYVTIFAIIIGVPIGVLTSIYMAMDCSKKVYRFLKPAVELLAGIPSVVYGFFGMVVLVPLVNRIFSMNGNTMLTASVILGVMILPTIIGISETAIRAVPKNYYEGALALGASHERSVFFVVVPAAKSGVFASIVLGIGRAIGETMAVIMIAGNQPRMPRGLLRGVRTLTANIAIEIGYAAELHRNMLVATAVVLFVFILIINLSFSLISRKQNSGGKSLFAASFVFKKESVRKKFYLTLKIMVRVASILTFSVLIFLIGYILIMGIPNIKPSLFAWDYNSTNVSLLPAFINTIIMTVFALIIAIPLGVFTGIYLIEYAKRGNKIVGLIRVTSETLSGIPSIVYGLFGSLFFVVYLGLGLSLVSGALTLTIMILPLIMRTTEEALKSVPDSFREGSFGLGAGRLRTVFKIVIPAAIPGILAGVILAVGRIVGETAALIHTAGSVPRLPQSILSSTRTLSVHMYALSSEGFYINQAYATAVMLLALTIGINFLSRFIAKRLTKG